MTLMMRQTTQGILWVLTSPSPMQQQVGQHPYADVQQQVDQRVAGEAAAPEGEDEVADQRNAAQNGDDKIHAIAGVAVEPIGEDQQAGDQQQQQKDLPRAVIAAAQHPAQHQQRRQHPHQKQQAAVAVGRLNEQEIHCRRHHGAGQQQKRHDLVQHRKAVHRGRQVGPPGRFRRTGQAVLAQRAILAVAADRNVAVRAGPHFSTSVAYSVTARPSAANPRYSLRSTLVLRSAEAVPSTRSSP